MDSELCSIARMLFQIGCGAVASDGAGAMTTIFVGAYNVEGRRARFPIMSINWGSMELRGASFNIRMLKMSCIMVGMASNMF